ncbi:MAG: VOC family protein [Acidobacteria bacterium]|nr:VOC family protein [Acidobacteriota bacterium]
MKRLPLVLLAMVIIAPVGAQLVPPNELGLAMGHVHLNVSDVELHRQIWINHFDAVPLEHEGLTGVKIPGMILLFRQQEPTGPSQETVLDHFGLKVRSRAEIVDRWRAAGMEVPFEFTGAAGFPNAYLQAPDGLRIELQQDIEQPELAIAHHLHYMKPDHLTVRQWYIDTFSAVASTRGRIQTADIPGMNLSFNPPRQRGPDPVPTRVGTRGRTIDHIGFEVSNLEAFCKQLEAKGIVFDRPYRENPDIGVATAFFTDPFGVYVELTEGLRQY